MAEHGEGLLRKTAARIIVDPPFSWDSHSRLVRKNKITTALQREKTKLFLKNGEQRAPHFYVPRIISGKRSNWSPVPAKYQMMPIKPATNDRYQTAATT